MYLKLNNHETMISLKDIRSVNSWGGSGGYSNIKLTYADGQEKDIPYGYDTYGSVCRNKRDKDFIQIQEALIKVAHSLLDDVCDRLKVLEEAAKGEKINLGDHYKGDLWLGGTLCKTTSPKRWEEE